MKYLTVVFALLIVLPMSAMAWTPTQMTLSAPASVHYDFDGTELNIPVTVTGTPARVIFSVFTKGKADQISRVQNGFRGWHYVDAIDTCVYFSPAYDFSIGTDNVTWSGQTHETYMQEGDGPAVGADEYTYYLWAYDYVGARVRATPPVADPNRQNVIVVDESPDGMPLANPFIQGKVLESALTPAIWTWETHFKFMLGSEPSNVELVETCYLGDNIGGLWAHRNGVNTYGNITWDDESYSTLYRKLSSDANNRAAVWKMQWVPNGTAVKDDSWGPDLNWDCDINMDGGMSTDGTYLYTMTGDQFNTTSMSVRAYIIDKESGDMLYDFYHQDWTDFDQYNSGVGGAKGADYLNGGPPDYFKIRNGLWYPGNFMCLKQCVDPIRYMETEDYTDFKRWTNKNGDWVSDMNWKPDATFPWACFGETPPKNRSFAPDHLNWVVNMVGQFGAVSFDLFAPDGTGIGYFMCQGDAERSSGTVQVCDAGSAFDGLYVDTIGGGEWIALDRLSLFFIAWDNFTGTITDQAVDVADAAPAAFAVAQNSPNPFNPTTTINFTIPEAGRVNVDVFNVAGQKVNTLVNGAMEAGNHIVTFDGSNLAAGVYFYTVKAGEFSKTMKMTLLK